MCGRFGLTANSKEIGRLFSVHNVPEVKPDYNIPPTRGVLGIRSSGKEREAHLFHWGLIPSWAKDEKIGFKLINARSETVASKPSFRSAYRTRRMIVPASYYYEWQKDGKEKTPFLIRLKDAEIFGMAGLWEQWTSPQTGEVIDSCTIITTDANNATRPVHDRMPVILHTTDFARWLGEEAADAEALTALLQPYPDKEMELYPVTREVGNPRFNLPESMEPVAA
jgi:putative SOS response-associated peptidase YedK